MQNKENSISKKLFWRYINSKLRGKIHSAHVLSIVNILLDELKNDLLNRKDVNIINFGKFKYIKLNPKKYFNVREQEIMWSKGSNIIRFIISKKIRSKLLKNVDIDKTYPDNYDTITKLGKKE